MSIYQELQERHQELLKRQETEADSAELITAVQSYIDNVLTQSEQVAAPRDRDQLRANLRFWASYVYDQTGVYPGTSLRPPQKAPPALDFGDISMPLPPAPAAPVSSGDETTAEEVPVFSPFESYSSVQSPDVPPPAPSPQPSRKSRSLWLIGAAVAVLALLCLAVGMLMFTTRDGPEYTEAATPTAVVVIDPPTGTVSLPTPTIVPEVTPSLTISTVTADWVLATHQVEFGETVISLADRYNVSPGAIVSQNNLASIDLSTANLAGTILIIPRPLTITHTILTGGPSPFERQTWVAKVQLLAGGGNGEYIFWADGQRLTADEFVVEGQGCRSLSYQIGVTSGDQAVSETIAIKPPVSFDCR